MKLRGIISLITTILVPLAGCVVLFGVFRDQWENAPYLPLIRSLRSGDAGRRREAALELGILRFRGERVRRAITPLIERLDDPDGAVRSTAAEPLLYFGADAAPAVPVLAKIIRGGRADLRAPELRILLVIGSGEANTVLTEALTDPDSDLRVETVKVLGGAGRSTRRFVPLLLEGLRSDPEASVRRASLEALVAIEPKSERVALAKLEALRDVSAELRKLAASLLDVPAPVPVVPALRRALRDRDAGVRAEVFKRLSQIGLRDPDVVPALCEALADAATHDRARDVLGSLNGWILYARADVVRSLAATIESAVPALIDALKSGDPRTRGVVAALLYKMISYSKLEDPPVPAPLRTAVAPLLAALKDRDPVFRLYLLMVALSERPTELLIPAPRELFDGQDGPRLEGASPATRARWRSAVAALAARVQARDPVPRSQVLIHQLPEDLVESLMPTIREALVDEDQQLRFEAMQLLPSLVSYPPSVATPRAH
jgi:HEAT repeat protein